jgi:hypothetical protein
MMDRTDRKQARRWATRHGVPGILILLLVIGLAGCYEPTPTPTATPVPPTLTPSPPPPPAPVTAPAGPDITVQVGQKIAIRASATGADGYRWELQGDAEISTTGPGDTTLYTAPWDVPDGGTIALLLVTAYNEYGESPQSSLVINIAPNPIPSPLPTITITSPLTEAVCPLNEECRFDVTGISSGVASNLDLQVIVFVRDGDWWFPHKWVTFETGDTWRRKTQIGSRPCWPAGYPFEIVAMVLTQTVAAEFPADSHSLPENYVAQSNRVTLMTTYKPLPIDLSHASFSQDVGSGITLSTTEQISLAIDYDLGTGDWVQVAVPVKNPDMSCMKELGFSMGFSLKGTGMANSFEVKLEDTDSSNYGWLSRPRGSVTTDWETIKLSLDHFEFWWDGDGQDMDMNWQEVMNILFAVSVKPGDEGGAGHVEISNMVLAPPAAP